MKNLKQQSTVEFSQNEKMQFVGKIFINGNFSGTVNGRTEKSVKNNYKKWCKSRGVLSEKF